MKKILASVAILAASASTIAADLKIDDQTKAQIEQIVHEYIVKNPQVLVEASKALEAQEEQAYELNLRSFIKEVQADKFVPVKVANNKDNKHYIIEFFDYNCGYCKKARVFTSQLAKKYDLDIYYIEFPILSSVSVQASAVGLALYQIDKEKYFAYQDKLMTMEGRLTSLDQIKKTLEEVKADVKAVLKLANSDSIHQALNKNLVNGGNIGVRGTPFIIIDGKVVQTRYDSAEDLAAYLDK